MEKLDRGPYETTITNMISNPKFKQTYMFYAYMVAQCQPHFTDKLQAPAAVYFFRDHYVLEINPAKFNEFTLEERLGVIKHEMLHIMNGHFVRLEHRSMKKFNYATDCSINQLIDINHLPKGCILPSNLPTKLKTVPTMQSAEQYYDIIDVEEDGDDNHNGAIDDHSSWQKSEGDADLQKDITKGMLDKATNETAKGRGDMPSNLNEALELFTRKSEVNWKQLLRKIVGNKKTNSRKTIMRSDRRFPKREDLRGKTKDRTFELAVVVDVSGSVDNNALCTLLAEIKHICDLTKTSAKMVQIDTQAYPPEELKAKARSIVRKAAGGTTLYPAIDMLKKHNVHFDALVVATDGGLCSSDVAAFEALRKRTIWLIEPSGHIMPEMNTQLMTAVKLKGKSDE